MMDLVAMMTEQEFADSGAKALSAQQRAALAAWGLRMFGSGRSDLLQIEAIKMSGHLIELSDGSRWEVDEVDSIVAESWLEGSTVARFDDDLYLVDDMERVSVTPFGG